MSAAASVGAPVIRALEIGFIIAFLVVPVLISTALKEVFNTPKDILLGCTTLGIFAVIAVEALFHQRIRLPRNRAGAFVLAFLGWAALSLAWSSDIAVASRDLGYHTSLVILFFAGFYYGREEERVDNLLHFPIAAGVLAAGFGLMQFYVLDEVVLPRVVVWPILALGAALLGFSAAVRAPDGEGDAARSGLGRAVSFAFERPVVGLAVMAGLTAGFDAETPAVLVLAFILVVLWVFVRALDPKETILTLAIRALVGIFTMLLANLIDPQLLLVLAIGMLLDESARTDESESGFLLAAGLLAVCATALRQDWNLGFLVLPGKPEEPVKIYSFMGHRNYLAGYIIAVLPLAVVRMVAAWTVVAPRDRGAWGVRLWRVTVYLTAIGLMLVTLMNTHTRGAWIGGIASLLFLVVWLLIRYRPFRLAGLVGLVVGAVGLIVVLFGWKTIEVPGLGTYSNPLNRHHQSAGRRAAETLNLHIGSAFQRALIYRTAWWIIFDHPMNCLLGTGIGTFGLNYMPAQKKVLKVPQNRKYVPAVNKSIYAHNEYWHYWSEVGLVGLGLLFGALYALLSAAHTRLREEPPGGPGLMFLGMCASLIATLVHNVFTFDFHLSYSGALFCSIAGMVLAQADGEFREYSWAALTGGTPEGRNPALVPGLALVVAGIVPMIHHLAGEAMRDHFWRNGFLKFRAQRFEEAFLDFEKAIAADPTRGEVLFDFGRSLMDSGRNQPAIKVFEQAKATFVDPANDHNIALCYYKEGKMAEAEAHYKKALELNEIYEQSLANLSYMYLASERDGEALGLLEIGSKNYPSNAAFPTSMGVVLAKQGRFPEAKVHFEKALKLNPKKASIWINAGTVYYNLGEVDEAEKAYVRALELEPNDAIGKQKLALVQLAKWGKAAKDNPNDLEIRRNYAMSLLAAGHAGPAASEARNILEAYPEDHATRYAYARALDLQGYREDARRELERLVREMPAGHALRGRVDELLRAVQAPPKPEAAPPPPREGP